jgi:hypothetical protein
MKLMLLLWVMGVLGISVAPSAAQETGDRTIKIEYYYKLVPGGTMEWLELYKRNHNPILKQLMQAGILKSETLYTRHFHAESPAWDYKVVMVWRDWAALDEAHQREPKIMAQLYPDKAKHDLEEKRRWELTTAHWDDVLQEVPLD